MELYFLRDVYSSLNYRNKDFWQDSYKGLYTLSRGKRLNLMLEYFYTVILLLDLTFSCLIVHKKSIWVEVNYRFDFKREPN